MPAAAIPIIAAIAAAASAGTGIYELASAPGGAKAPKAPVGVNPQQSTNIKAAVSQEAPTLQSQLGGSVSPDYYLQLAQVLSGQNTPGAGGSAQSVINSLFGTQGGTGAPPAANAAPSPSVQNFTPAGLGGGNSSSNFVQGGLSDLLQRLSLG